MSSGQEKPPKMAIKGSQGLLNIFITFRPYFQDYRYFLTLLTFCNLLKTVHSTHCAAFELSKLKMSVAKIKVALNVLHNYVMERREMRLF